MMSQNDGLKIAIVIPILNEALYIGGLLNQLKDFDQLELIVVDGGSTDESISIVEQFDVHLLKSEKGRSKQMNKGATMATSPYLLFLHADLNLPKGFYKVLEKTIESGIMLANFQLKFDLDHWFLNANCYFTKFSTTIFQFGDQGLFIEQNLFRKIGGFNENLSLAEGQDLIRRAKKHTELKKIQLKLTVSARKYKIHGIFYLQFIYYLIYLLYRMKVKPHQLESTYKKLLRKKFLGLKFFL